MSLTAAKVRAIANLLSDERQAHAAAHVLAEEAKRRGVLVADLITEALAPAQASAPPPPKFSDVDANRIDVAIGNRINFHAYGLRTEILHETDRAWRVRMPTGENPGCQKASASITARTLLEGRSLSFRHGSGERRASCDR